MGVLLIEHMNYIYTQEEYKKAKKNLLTYYNVSERVIDAVVNSNGNEVIELPSLLEEQLIAAYVPLGLSKADKEILQTLLLLVYCFSLDADIIGSSEDIRIRDILKLFLLCAGTKDGDSIIVKNRTRSFRLDNRSNWIINEVVKPLCEKKLDKGRSPSDIESELDLLSRRQRGRRYKDPYVPILLWGTYKLLSDRHCFQTPMPNRLCSFLIDLLKIMKVFPHNTQVDEFWIRAQLRYIRSKKDKRPDS